MQNRPAVLRLGDCVCAALPGSPLEAAGRSRPQLTRYQVHRPEEYPMGRCQRRGGFASMASGGNTPYERAAATPESTQSPSRRGLAPILHPQSEGE